MLSAAPHAVRAFAAALGVCLAFAALDAAAATKPPDFHRRVRRTRHHFTLESENSENTTFVSSVLCIAARNASPSLCANLPRPPRGRRTPLATRKPLMLRDMRQRVQHERRGAARRFVGVKAKAKALVPQAFRRRRGILLIFH